MSALTLTAGQETFASNFVATRSLARAYRMTFNPPENWTAQKCHREGRRLFELPHVRERIEELTDAAASGPVTVEALIKIFGEIYEADPNELIALRVGACRYCNGLDHRYHWREHEYLARLDEAERNGSGLPDVGGGLDYDHTAAPHSDCPACRGEGEHRVVPHDTENLSPGAKRLYCGVKYGKNGPEIIMADRMKALELLGRVIGAFRDNVNLTAQVKTIGQAVQLTTTDPNRAAELYREMITGISAN